MRRTDDVQCVKKFKGPTRRTRRYSRSWWAWPPRNPVCATHGFSSRGHCARIGKGIKRQNAELGKRLDAILKSRVRMDLLMSRSLPVDERHPTLDAFLNGNDGNENISQATLNPPPSVPPKDGVVRQFVIMIRVENDEHAAISACSPSLATRPPIGPLPGPWVAPWKFRLFASRHPEAWALPRLQGWPPASADRLGAARSASCSCAQYAIPQWPPQLLDFE